LGRRAADLKNKNNLNDRQRVDNKNNMICMHCVVYLKKIQKATKKFK